ncbi:MAG: hypothetical protein Q8M12_02695 [bacterium]|nr:hypothetical protein [bacterium]
MQLCVGVARSRTDMRQTVGCQGGNRGLFKRKPGGDANQRAGSNQQQHRFDGIERPEMMPAVAAAKRRVQQHVTQAVVRVQPGRADLRAPTVWAGA